jgi:CO/xanthine dehydrogenase Mo-binding subunit
VRVITGNVGGSFGMKAAPYLNMSASCGARSNRPVKWTDSALASSPTQAAIIGVRRD